MNEYLIDRETLGRLIDELIKRKPLPVNTAEDLQNAEMNELLNRNESNPDVFKNFFIRAGIDLESIIANAITTFGKEYLGEQNV